jgi:glycerophosphoryl diester phosphodiesterase
VPERRTWVFLGAAALTVAVVASLVALPHLQRYVGLAPPRQIDEPIGVTLPDDAAAHVLGIAHNAGNNLATIRAAAGNNAGAVEIDVMAAHGQLVAGREYRPFPGLARRLFRGPSLVDAWDGAARVPLVKLDLKQSDPGFLERVVAFLSPRVGSRAVMVSSPDRAALLLLHDRLPGVQLLYSAADSAALDRLKSDEVLVAALTGLSAFQGLVDASFVRWAQAHQLQVIAWTVDGGQRLAQLLRLGVDGVTTANLAVLRSLGGP